MHTYTHIHRFVWMATLQQEYQHEREIDSRNPLTGRLCSFHSQRSVIKWGHDGRITGRQTVLFDSCEKSYASVLTYTCTFVDTDRLLSLNYSYVLILHKYEPAYIIMHTYIHTYILECVQPACIVHTNIHAYIHTLIHTYFHTIHTYIHTCLTHIHTCLTHIHNTGIILKKDHRKRIRVENRKFFG